MLQTAARIMRDAVGIRARGTFLLREARTSAAQEAAFPAVSFDALNLKSYRFRQQVSFFFFLPKFGMQNQID